MNKFIKDLLDKNSVSQKELAEILGISASAIAQWQDTINISPEILFKISKLFSISIDDLLNEKFPNESIENICDRLYNIGDVEFEELLEENNQKKLCDFSVKLKNIKTDFFALLREKVFFKLNNDEQYKFDYLEKYFQIKPHNSKVFYNIDTNFIYGKDKDIVFEIVNYIKNNFSTDEKVIMWELEKIYECTINLTWSLVIKNYNNLDTNVFENIFQSFTQFEKSLNCTSSISYEIINKCINFGADILYTLNDFQEDSRDPSSVSLNANYTFEELNKFEGEKKFINELTEVKEFIYKVDFHLQFIDYYEYQKLINHKRMKDIQMYAQKNKNPIQYWQYLITQPY